MHMTDKEIANALKSFFASTFESSRSSPSVGKTLLLSDVVDDSNSHMVLEINSAVIDSARQKFKCNKAQGSTWLSNKVNGSCSGLLTDYIATIMQDIVSSGQIPQGDSNS